MRPIRGKKGVLCAVVMVAAFPGGVASGLLEGWSYDPCPSLCDTYHNDPSNWTTYHDLDFLVQC
jgi:hypothetical protein